MKQRIRVTAICKKDDTILLLKRSGGRVDTGAQNYELPTGKIVFGEQPEEAMSRVILDGLSVQAESLQISDVVTFTGLAGSSEQGNLYIVYEVKLQNDEISLTNSERYTSYKWVKMDETGLLPLDEASMMVLQITATKTGVLGSRIIRTEQQQVLPASDFATIYTDGGARGNPGPSGLGYYIIGPDGKEIKRGGEFLGFSSSRLAEYYGL